MQTGCQISKKVFALISSGSIKKPAAGQSVVNLELKLDVPSGSPGLVYWVWPKIATSSTTFSMSFLLSCSHL